MKNIIILSMLLFSSIGFADVEPCPEMKALDAANSAFDILSRRMTEGTMKYTVNAYNSKTGVRSVIRTYKFIEPINNSVLEMADVTIVDSSCNIIWEGSGGGNLKPAPVQ